MAQELSNLPQLRVGRVHEVCGPGSFVFSAVQISRQTQSCIWVREAWQSDQPSPNGIAGYADPSNLLIALGHTHADVLAVTEEALRFGAVGMVIAEASQPITLKAGRRLQLAAEAGKSTGIIIISDGMGSNAAETRWRCSPVFDPSDSTLMRWEIIKNKSGTLGNWIVRWDDKARRVHVVSGPSQRKGLAQPSG